MYSQVKQTQPILLYGFLFVGLSSPAPLPRRAQAETILGPHFGHLGRDTIAMLRA